MKITLMTPRRGWTLLHLVGGMFVGSLVLGMVVPLYLTAQRNAESGMLRARMNTAARELGARFREDVRQASSVQVGNGGRTLSLVLPHPGTRGPATRVVYRAGSGGLVREARAGAGSLAEVSEFAAPLAAWTFNRSGTGYGAHWSFRQPFRERELRLELDSFATPRSAL